MKPMPHLPSVQRRRIEPLSVLPVFFDLKAKRAVVIGGSAAAAWKAELLAAAGAHVDIYAERPSEEMLTLASNGGSAGTVRLIPDGWSLEALAGAAVIVADAATRADALDISKAARTAGVAVNLIDRPEFCDFQFGAIVNRSPLVIGISTSGAAPVFAQEIRSRIECILPPQLAAWLRIAGRIRHIVRERCATARQRRAFWERFARRALLSPPGETEFNAACFEADATLEQVTVIQVDTVEDLTLRDIRALQRADIIHVAGQCAEGILDFARREAKRIHSSGPLSPKEDKANRVIIRGRSPSNIM